MALLLCSAGNKLKINVNEDKSECKKWCAKVLLVQYIFLATPYVLSTGVGTLRSPEALTVRAAQGEVAREISEGSDRHEISSPEF